MCSASAKKSTHLARIEAKRTKIETKLSQSTAKNVCTLASRGGLTLQSGQNVGQIIDNGIGSRLIEVNALVRTQRQDSGAGAFAGLDA